MRILAISGSLRATTSSAALLRAAARIAPRGIEVVFYHGLGTLPHFSPDLDVEPLPEAVRSLRAQIATADALMISSPEYAHGARHAYLRGSAERPHRPWLGGQ